MELLGWPIEKRHKELTQPLPHIAIVNLEQFAWNLVFGGKQLTEGIDYTVRMSTSGTTYAMTHTSLIMPSSTIFNEGIGRYYGTVHTRVYGGLKVSIANAQVAITDEAYTGNALKPVLTAMLNNAELIEGTDYTVALPTT